MKPILYSPEHIQDALKNPDPKIALKILLQVSMGQARILKPKRNPVHHRKYDPTSQEVEAMLELTKKINPFDYYVIYLLSCGGHEGKGIGLRVGEVLSDHRNTANLPGLQIEDLRVDPPGIWVRGKMKHEELMPLTPEIVAGLQRDIYRKRTKGLIFDQGYRQPCGA